jgi:terminase small subunit-like protein
MGRPSAYRAEIADAICEGLIEGRSLREVCSAPGMPPESTVRQWALDDVQGFGALFTRATQIRAQRLADEIVELSDEDCTYIDETGRRRIDQGAVAQLRLRVDTRKWVASKLLPRIYGDRIVAEHVGKDSGPIQVEVVRAGILDKIARLPGARCPDEAAEQSESD